MRTAGFKKVLLRGDCHFSITDNFDYCTDQDVQFVFGVAAHSKLVEIAEALGSGAWSKLRRDSKRGKGHQKENVKQRIVEERGYRNLELEEEHYAEFAYRPTKCAKEYRIVALRKKILVKEGQNLLIPEIRFFFYITNAKKSWLSPRSVIRHANERCNQENLIEQAKNGVHAMRMPCDTLLANDAYMLIACLAWNLKAWLAQLWPDREEGEALRKMEYRRFIASVIAIPCQVVKTGRRVVIRALSYS